MKAVVIAADGALRVADVAEPRPGPHEVLVDVAAAAVNRADLAQRAGRHEPGPGSAGDGARIAGMDAAGVVAQVGADVETVRTGDRVMGLVAGGYAQRAVLDARLAIPVPGTWSLVEAAAAVSGLQTGYDALVNAAGLAPGEVVVVQGASTPVGLTGIQIARHLGAGMIMGTIRTGRAHAQVVSAGADLVIHTTSESVADAVLKATGGRGADVIVDHVGGDTLPDAIRSLAIEGRLVSVGRLAGAKGELDLESLASSACASSVSRSGPGRSRSTRRSPEPSGRTCCPRWNAASFARSSTARIRSTAPPRRRRSWRPTSTAESSS